MMDGYLLVDKPESWTSFDVVAKIRNILKNETGQKIKVGHTGTLDPFATGLLIIVIGSYTKKAEQFSKLDKTYEAELKLGFVSSTGDVEGKITEKSNQKPLLLEEIESVLKGFTGEIEQTPHKFSAMKIGGQRAYKLARAGKEVALEPRKVKIHGIDNVVYEYPKLKFRTKVSSGTYVRSLAEDIGEALNSGAYLTSLRRTGVGKFGIEGSISVEELEHTKILTNIKAI